jgi:hypothetical protein
LRRKFKEAEEEEGTGEDDEPAWMRLGSKIVDGIQISPAGSSPLNMFLPFIVIAANLGRIRSIPVPFWGCTNV